MKNLNKKIQAQFNNMCETGKLYKSKLTGLEVWNLYLKGFGNDPVFRDPEKSVHDCNHCNNFIRRYGNIVALDGNMNIMTIFDVITTKEYQATVNGLKAALISAPIADVFFETYNELNGLPYERCNKSLTTFKLGVDENHKQYTKAEAEAHGGGVVATDEIRKFNHFSLQLPKDFVDMGGESIESIQAKYRSAKEVFQRAMEEISVDTLELVRDLITQGSLLNGETHLNKVEGILRLRKAYNSVSSEIKDNWCWEASYGYGLAKFKNELIGVLCSELAEGEEINKACQSWNKRVDPANYMKAVAPITETQKKNAREFVEENDYEESFTRRHATIKDISVEEIKHINAGDGKIKSVSMFDGVKPNKSIHKRNEFKGIDEVSIDKFMEDILPTCSSVEAFLDNSHEGNMVSLTTANDKESKPIFKWDNNYSWTFNGNLAGKSQLREAVSAKGGRVDGVFRFSQSWNELERNQSLMDLHVFMPGNNHTTGKVHNSYGIGRRVGWNNRNDRQSGGSQDVDYVHQAPTGHVPVENITFPILSKMPEGKYICKIHNWSYRNSGGRGKAEIEFNGNVFQYEYPATKNNEWITVAEVTLEDGVFTIEHILPETNSSKEIYGLETKQFHKVNLMCLSPNHWGENKSGNKHYMFMLDGCRVPSDIRSFHNENLIPELAAHRKVLEVLGAVNMLEPKNEQLSGLGFNSTVKDEVILKLAGTHKRMIKVKF